MCIKADRKFFDFYPLFSSEDACVWQGNWVGIPTMRQGVLPAGHSFFLGGEQAGECWGQHIESPDKTPCSHLPVHRGEASTQAFAPFKATFEAVSFSL